MKMKDLQLWTAPQMHFTDSPLNSKVASPPCKSYQKQAQRKPLSRGGFEAVVKEMEDVTGSHTGIAVVGRTAFRVYGQVLSGAALP